MQPNTYVSLEIFPSFLAPCKMELKQENECWSLSVTIQNRNGGDVKFWNANTDNPWYSERIVDYGRRVVKEALSDYRMILDGISLTCTVRENDILKTHSYRCPEQGTSEWLLAGAFLVRVEHFFNDQDLTNYIELLEGYFERMQVKLFDETPKRLRFYGSLNVEYLKEIESIISKVSKEKALVLDFTNFEGMGTFFYNRFESLISIPELKVLVIESNDRLLKQVKDIGFRDEQIQLLFPPTP